MRGDCGRSTPVLEDYFSQDLVGSGSEWGYDAGNFAKPLAVSRRDLKGFIAANKFALCRRAGTVN